MLVLQSSWWSSSLSPTVRVEEQEHYWLIQYQKLLDSKPQGLEEAEDRMEDKVHCTALDCIVLYCNSLYCTALHCTVVTLTKI